MEERVRTEESFQEDGRRKGRVTRVWGFEEISRGSQFFKSSGAHLETTMIARLLGPTLDGERRVILWHTCFFFFFCPFSSSYERSGFHGSSSGWSNVATAVKGSRTVDPNTIQFMPLYTFIYGQKFDLLASFLFFSKIGLPTPQFFILNLL